MKVWFVKSEKRDLWNVNRYSNPASPARFYISSHGDKGFAGLSVICPGCCCFSWDLIRLLVYLTEIRSIYFFGISRNRQIKKYLLTKLTGSYDINDDQLIGYIFRVHGLLFSIPFLNLSLHTPTYQQGIVCAIDFNYRMIELIDYYYFFLYYNFMSL